MSVLMVCENPLFLEVVAGSIESHAHFPMLRTFPKDAPEVIDRLAPEVIIVDESISSQDLERLFASARKLARCRVLLLNAESNDFVAVDSRRAVVRKTTDLVQTIMEGQAVSLEEERVERYHAQRQAAEIQSGLYGFLAALCNQRPTPDFVRRFRAVGVETILEQDVEAQAGQGLKEMAGYLTSTQAQAEAEVAQALAVDWTRLFRGISPGYGPPPPYEAVHTGSDDIQVLQTLARTYEEAGAQVDENTNNRLDYVGVELDFLRFLTQRAADAWSRGDETQAMQSTLTAEAFLDTHLSQWLPIYCEKALAEARTDFFHGFIHLLQATFAEVASLEGEV